MAKKHVNKTEAVRDYLEDHPGAMPVEIVKAFAAQGIKMTRMHVSAIKTKLKTTGAAQKVAKTEATVEAAPAAVALEKPASGMITLEQIKKVAHTIQTLGGYRRTTEVLSLVKELGGLKKFKDLAEAMTATWADEVPF
jgi:prephenate dehydratase